MVYMEKVQLLDKGTYTCECRNAAGSSSKEHHLEVHGERGGPEICGDGWRCCDLSHCKVQMDPKPLPGALDILEGMLLPGPALPLHLCTAEGVSAHPLHPVSLCPQHCQGSRAAATPRGKFLSSRVARQSWSARPWGHHHPG